MGSIDHDNLNEDQAESPDDAASASPMTPGESHLETPLPENRPPIKSASQSMSRTWIGNWFTGGVVSLAVHCMMLLGAAVWVFQFALPGTLQPTEDPFSNVLPYSALRSEHSERPLHISPQKNQEPEPISAFEVDMKSFAPTVQQTLQRQFSESQGRSDADNLSRLEQFSKQLQSLSDTTRTSQIASQLSASLGLPQRSPAQSETGDPLEFDVHTSQISDVIKESGSDGKPRYVAQLVDQNGVSITVELAESDGERLVQVFELINQYPLLRQVYHSVAMSVIDQFLESQSTTSNSSGSRRVPSH